MSETASDEEQRQQRAIHLQLRSNRLDQARQLSEARPDSGPFDDVYYLAAGDLDDLLPLLRAVLFVAPASRIEYEVVVEGLTRWVKQRGLDEQADAMAVAINVAEVLLYFNVLGFASGTLLERGLHFDHHALPREMARVRFDPGGLAFTMPVPRRPLFTRLSSVAATN